MPVKRGGGIPKAPPILGGKRMNRTSPVAMEQPLTPLVKGSSSLGGSTNKGSARRKTDSGNTTFKRASKDGLKAKNKKDATESSISGGKVPAPGVSRTEGIV
jgi:hypothetical protein